MLPVGIQVIMYAQESLLHFLYVLLSVLLNFLYLCAENIDKKDPFKNIFLTGF